MEKNTSIEGVCAHNKFNYIELPSANLAEAKRFYGKVFGWTFQDWGEDYAEFIGAGVSGGLDRNGIPNTGGGTVVMVYSDDLDASEALVKAEGGQITIEAFDFPGGRRFHFYDPNDNEISVWTSKPLA